MVQNNTANHVGEMGQVVAARKVSITMVEEWQFGAFMTWLSLIFGRHTFCQGFMRLVVDQGGKINTDLKQIVEAGVRGQNHSRA